MDVYLRSHCCEFEFQKKRWQQPLKKNMLNNKVKLSFKINLIACSCLYFYIFVFFIFDQIMFAYLFFISGFIQGGGMGLTYSELTYRI